MTGENTLDRMNAHRDSVREVLEYAQHRLILAAINGANTTVSRGASQDIRCSPQVFGKRHRGLHGQIYCLRL